MKVQPHRLYPNPFFHPQHVIREKDPRIILDRSTKPIENEELPRNYQIHLPHGVTFGFHGRVCPAPVKYFKIQGLIHRLTLHCIFQII